MEVNYVGKSDVHVRLVILICVCVCVRLGESIRVIIWDNAFCRVKNDEHVTIVTMCACVCACVMCTATIKDVDPHTHKAS